MGFRTLKADSTAKVDFRVIVTDKDEKGKEQSIIHDYHDAAGTLVIYTKEDVILHGFATVARQIDGITTLAGALGAQIAQIAPHPLFALNIANDVVAAIVDAMTKEVGDALAKKLFAQTEDE